VGDLFLCRCIWQEKWRSICIDWGAVVFLHRKTPSSI